jgi:hypothetical protein
MIKPVKSRSRTVVTAVTALALALVIGATVQARSESGGFFCGYGDCWITYDYCFSTPQYQDLGNGECEVTLGEECFISGMACDGGAFGWVGLGGYSWGVESYLNR